MEIQPKTEVTDNLKPTEPKKETRRRRKNKKTRSKEKILQKPEKTNDRATRTGYNLRSLLILAIFSCILGLVGAKPIEKTFEIQKFKSQPGIYFEEIGQAKLINSEWHLIVYFKLDGFWQQMDLFKKHRRRMEHICNYISESCLYGEYITCNQTLQQFDLHFGEVESKNSLFHAINIPNNNKRTKRGLIDGVGMLAGELFGVLDSRFAEKYRIDIETVEENEHHALELIKNQTSIIDSTLNLMKKSEMDIQKQFDRLSVYCNNISLLISQKKEEIETINRKQLFSEMAIQTMLALERLEKLQDTFIDVITDTQQGHTNPLLIPPEQLREQISYIKAHVSNELSLIGEIHGENLFEVYASMKISTRLVANMLIFDIQLPLVNTNEFQIFRTHAIPSSIII